MLSALLGQTSNDGRLASEEAMCQEEGRTEKGAQLSREVF